MATLMMRDGRAREVEPEDGKSFHLRELYRLLNCRTVEVVNLQDGTLLIIDEEGKFQTPITINDAATELAHKHLRIQVWDVICGDVLRCLDREFE